MAKIENEVEFLNFIRSAYGLTSNPDPRYREALLKFTYMAEGAKIALDNTPCPPN